MKSAFKVPSVLSILLCGAAWADSDADDSSMRLSLLETQVAEATTKTIHGNYGAKTASLSPQILGENWFFTADMLWWHCSQGGMDYAQLFEAEPSTVASNHVDNRTLDFKWDYGFRAGIGTFFQHDKWDLYLNFTWFRTDNSSVSSLNEGQFLVPLTAAPALQASKIKAHWNIHFYDFSLNFGRNFFISSQVALHPYIGLNSAFISQTARSYSDIFDPFVDTLNTKDRNDFWGIGPDAGIEGKWFILSGFHLFGAASSAIFWGDFTVRHKEWSPQEKITRFNLNFDTHKVVPMVQFQLGLGYETTIYHNQYAIALDARYEYQYWWEQNQIPFTLSSDNLRYSRYAEDLSFQGITIHARFDF